MGINPYGPEPVSAFTIRQGEIYRYTAEQPAGCKGKRYQVVHFIIDVPSYQEKVLIKCLEGPDRGLWFAVSPANFASRYEPVEAPGASLERGN